MWQVHIAEPQGPGSDNVVGGPISPGRTTPPRTAAPPGEAAVPPTGRAAVQADELTAAVHAAQAGDEEAFRQLFRAVQPGLLRYLRVLVGGGPEDAEDIASETWLQIARDLSGFDGDGDGFRGWAATVARNRAMDHLRRVRRRPVADLPFEYLAELTAAEDTAGSALATVSTADSLALIARLPRDQAEAVLLRVVLDLDAESAAKVLGKRSGSVRMAAHRGLRKLAKLLEQPGGGPADGVPQQRSASGSGRPPENSSDSPAQGVTQPRAATLKDMR
ncbi:RNA polymerase sigma factor [Kitasatospora sp. McL0602]|uniref:RNA polymerase sigma factor n=1 Tax=Kitasatospora sp. McL0602 TaxID=3439530 RepID=UPI003F88A13D